jgi:tRNA(Ile)-lysidine synthase
MAGAVAACVHAGPGGALLVGYSGGLDSTVLLHALAALPGQRARGLRALHVHHGLHPQADAWAAHCEATCREWNVPYELARVEVGLDSGLGIEGAARAARHSAFACALAPGETLALAHHRGDQAETVLLRLLRAAGGDSLAAMHARRAFAQGAIWRPLLSLPRADLLEYARVQGLAWIEDPSNADPRFDRNFLRTRVLPSLRERWPEAEAALARSATLLAEDAHLLEHEAALRLALARTPEPRTLATAPLLALSAPWRARVLRHWLATLGLPPPPGRAFALIDAELLGSRHDAQPEYRWAGLRLQRWRGLLHVETETSALPVNFHCEWDGAAALSLPGGGLLQIARADAAPPLPGELAPLRVGARHGGERIRLPGREHSHALKDCLLRSGVPPWLRRGLPLLRAPDEELLAAGDAVLSERWQRLCGTRGLTLRWQPAPARDCFARPETGH